MAPKIARLDAGSELVAGFALVEYLGRGQFGQVWKGRDTATGRPVAVKIIDLTFSPGALNPAGLRAFKRACSLSHPNLVPTLAARLITTDARQLPIDDLPRIQKGELKDLVIVTGLGEKSLAARLREMNPNHPPPHRRRGLPVAELLRYVRGAARGIDYLNQPDHGFGPGDSPIVHGEIKPEDLLIVEGEVQIADRGVSNVFASDVHSDRLGALAYCAPEVVRGKPGPGTDQYALAVSYYRLRTGRFPIPDRDRLLHFVVEYDLGLADLDLSSPAVGPGERDVLRQATARAPTDRFPSCEAFVEALAELPEMRAAMLRASGAAPAPAARSGRTSAPIPIPRPKSGAVKFEAIVAAANVPPIRSGALRPTAARPADPSTSPEAAPSTDPDPEPRPVKAAAPPVAMPAPPAPHIPVPHSTPPGYEVLGELGRGGMGVVYKARQVKLNRVVAVKMILHGTIASRVDQARFHREAGAFARLSHEHIVRIYDFGDVDDLPYFSMEYVPGGSLADRLQTGPLRTVDAARLVEGLSRAAHHAHVLGIIHRDLKPANVLLAADGTPKLTDFGLAKCLGEPSDLTKTGSVMGTLSYMAPEQAGGNAKAVGPAADVYSLGAILYECLTGRPPFRGETVYEVLDQVRGNTPTPADRVRPGVPRRLSDVCRRCLEKDPADRYTSAAAMADALRTWVTTEGTGKPPRPPWWQELWARFWR